MAAKNVIRKFAELYVEKVREWMRNNPPGWEDSSADIAAGAKGQKNKDFIPGQKSYYLNNKVVSEKNLPRGVKTEELAEVNERFMSQLEAYFLNELEGAWDFKMGDEENGDFHDGNPIGVHAPVNQFWMDFLTECMEVADEITSRKDAPEPVGEKVPA